MDRKTSLTLIFSFLGLALFSQSLPPRTTVFSSEDYLGHHQVFCAESMTNGRLAFGTIDKLLIYGGEGFRMVKVGADKNVLSVDRTKEGRIFIGGSSLMAEVVPDSSGNLKARSLIPLLPEDLKDFGNIWDTWCAPNGDVYFNAYEHLFLYRGDSLEAIPAKTRFHGLSTPSGQPVVQDLGEGLYRLDGAKKRSLKGSEAFSKGTYVRKLLAAPKGEKKGGWLIFTRKEGVHRYNPEKGEHEVLDQERSKEDWSSFSEPESPELYSACRLHPEENPYEASYAIGTVNEGIYLLDRKAKILAHLSSDEGLPSKMIWSLDTDERGNVWATTDAGLVLIHLASPFRMIEKGERFEGGVNDIVRPSLVNSGTPSDPPLFLATQEGVWWGKGDRFKHVKGSRGTFTDLLTMERRAGVKAVLAAGKNKLYQLDREVGEEKYSMGPIALDEHVYDLANMPGSEQGREKERILAGGREGFYILAPSDQADDGWETLWKLNGLPESVHSVRSEKAGPDSIRLWGGLTSKGVIEVTLDDAFEGHRIAHYDSSDGVPQGLVKVFEDPKGNAVLFGTERGLYRKGENGLTPCCRFGDHFCDREGQISSFVKGVEEALWLKDQKGGAIKHLIPEGKGYRIDSLPFRQLGWSTIRSFFPEMERTLIGAEQGLASYDPELEKTFEMDRPCRIKEVRGAGDTLLFGGVFRKKKGEGAWVPVQEQPDAMVPQLPFRKNRLHFRFEAAFPDRQEALRYRFKLKGFDSSWSKWTKKTSKEYTSLPEAPYRFQVQAKNVYGKKSEKAGYRFRILPPWYRTWWAYSGYGMASIAFLLFLIRMNNRRLLAQKRRLERTVQERTHEIREQNQELERKNQALEEANHTISQQKEKVEKAHEEITKSIDYAQKIQHALLRSGKEASSNAPEHFILFKPQSQVSGDFYWSKEHQGYFYLAAVDCTGHGVPGAFMSMLGISQLNEIMSREDAPPPGAILTELRERVVRELSGSDPENAAKDGMDAAIVRVPIDNSDPAPNPKEARVEVQFAGAQNPLYAIRTGIADEPPHASIECLGEKLEGDPVKPFKQSSDGIEVKGDAQPVGYDEHAQEAFRTINLELQKGDMLYCFSDGYADQFGGTKGKKFGYGRFKKLLVSLCDRSLQEQKDALERNFEEWKAGSDEEQIDDVVVYGLRL